MKLEAFAIILIAAMISNASAVYWSSCVSTNSSSWCIYRESQNLSFESSGSVEGKITPVEVYGRSLSPYLSYYAELGANDVRLSERTSALEGSYKSVDEIEMRSAVYPNEIDIYVDKPAASDIYTISYRNETWPVFIGARRAIAYSGKQINDRELEGNNGDFVGANFLYNHELYVDRTSVMWLQRMNATVLATNDAILLVEFKPTKYLGYLIQANFSGMADLSYRNQDFRKTQNDLRRSTYPYPSISEGDERYYGTYNLSRKIEMRSTFEENVIEQEKEYYWLPCDYGGWNDMMDFDKKSYGYGTNEIFDCTCDSWQDQGG